MTAGERGELHRLGYARLVPWFIIGFLALIAARTFGLVPTLILPALGGVATVFTIVSMAALGLGTDMRMMARSGPRVSAAVMLSLTALGLVSFGVIKLLRLN